MELWALGDYGLTTGQNRALSLCGIGVLLETNDLAATNAPQVSELRVQARLRGLVRRAISSCDYDRVAGIEEFCRHCLKIIPFGGQSKENSFGNGSRTYIGIAIRVGEVLRFVPDNGGVHRGKRGRTVAACKGGIDVSDQIEMRSPWGKPLREVRKTL